MKIASFGSCSKVHGSTPAAALRACRRSRAREGDVGKQWAGRRGQGVLHPVRQHELRHSAVVFVGRCAASSRTAAAQARRRRARPHLAVALHQHEALAEHRRREARALAAEPPSHGAPRVDEGPRVGAQPAAQRLDVVAAHDVPHRARAAPAAAAAAALLGKWGAQRGRKAGRSRYMRAQRAREGLGRVGARSHPGRAASSSPQRAGPGPVPPAYCASSSTLTASACRRVDLFVCFVCTLSVCVCACMCVCGGGYAHAAWPPPRPHAPVMSRCSLVTESPSLLAGSARSASLRGEGVYVCLEGAELRGALPHAAPLAFSRPPPRAHWS